MIQKFRIFLELNSKEDEDAPVVVEDDDVLETAGGVEYNCC
jgi:hypothetical protein